LAVSLENISHPALRTLPIVSRYDFQYKKQNSGQYTSGQTSCQSKSETEILVLVL